MALINAPALALMFVSLCFLFAISSTSPTGVTPGSSGIPTTPSRSADSPHELLDAHNEARKAVGVAPLVWNNTLASYAESCANDMSKVCGEAECNAVKSYGQNFAQSYAGEDITGVVQFWLDQEKHCHPAKKPFRSTEVLCLFYTHVVSPKSTSVGCAKAVPCLHVQNKTMILCNYYP